MALACLQTYSDPQEDLQKPFDVAVVMSSVLRPTIKQALESIFAQDLKGRIQVLVGVDKPSAPTELIDNVCKGRPPHCSVQLIYPGYSTSKRHGGLHPAYDGGVLRCVLSYLANSRYVAYLDDDNWWAPTHLSTLLQAVEGVDCAYSLRWYVHPITRRPIGIDEWESVGPGKKGIWNGWIDPNCLLVDKLACEKGLRWWTIPNPKEPTGMSADTNFYSYLRNHHSGRATNVASVYYQLSESDGNHQRRMKFLAEAYRRAGEASEASPPAVEASAGALPADLALFEIESAEGRLRCYAFRTVASRTIFKQILEGHTYPLVPFIGEVRTVLDIGANVGAASLFFALRYPEAKVYALEPAAQPFAVLARNAAQLANIRPYNIGLLDSDKRVPLFHGAFDSVTSSVGRSAFNTQDSELITLRQADKWLAQESIREIDILKIDTEGCEVAILRSIQRQVRDAKVIYIEYHSEDDRHVIDQMLTLSHILFSGHAHHPHRGELCYVNRASFPSPRAMDQHKIESVA